MTFPWADQILLGIASLIDAVDIQSAIRTYLGASLIAHVPRSEVDVLPFDASRTLTLIIPARNEAQNIRECVKSVTAQKGAEWTCIVVDDGSEDGTADGAVSAAGGDSWVSILRLEGPPEGWAGKVHAMYRGAELSTAEWIAFMDADCRLGPGAISDLLSFAESRSLDLVSMGASQSAKSTAWPLVTPLGLSLILQSASPDGNGKNQALAVGHFILVRREKYLDCGTYAAVKSSRADDIEFSTLVRDHGGSTQFCWGGDLLSSSQLASWTDLWGSWRKSFHAGMNGSVVGLLAGGLFFVAWGSAPFAFLCSRDPTLRLLGAASWTAQLLSHRVCATGMRVGLGWSLLAPFARIVLGGILVDSGARAAAGGGSTWKGRSVAG